MLCFNIVVHAQSTERTLFNFLILGKSKFPPKKFYNIDCRSKSWIISYCVTDVHFTCITRKKWRYAISICINASDMLEHLDLSWTNSHQHGVLRLRRGGGIETGKKSQHFFQFKICFHFSSRRFGLGLLHGRDLRPFEHEVQSGHCRHYCSGRRNCQ